MKRVATHLTLAVLLASSAAQVAASTAAAPPLKAVSAGNLKHGIELQGDGCTWGSVDLRQTAGRYRHLQRLRAGAGPDTGRSDDLHRPDHPRGAKEGQRRREVARFWRSGWTEINRELKATDFRKL